MTWLHLDPDRAEAVVRALAAARGETPVFVDAPMTLPERPTARQLQLARAGEFGPEAQARAEAIKAENLARLERLRAEAAARRAARARAWRERQERALKREAPVIAPPPEPEALDIDVVAAVNRREVRVVRSVLREREVRLVGTQGRTRLRSRP